MQPRHQPRHAWPPLPNKQTGLRPGFVVYEALLLFHDVCKAEVTVRLPCVKPRRTRARNTLGQFTRRMDATSNGNTKNEQANATTHERGH
eukprot:7084052-Alexandrium_andersonii.AAC.1